MNSPQVLDSIIAKLRDVNGERQSDIEVDECLSPIVRHYINEIGRFKNSLDYIGHKIARSLKNNSPIELTILEFIIYRLKYEHDNPNEVESELKILSHQSPSSCRFIIQRIEDFSWDKAVDKKSTDEILSLRFSIPTFSISHLKPVMSEDSILQNFQAMDLQSKNRETWIRINSFDTSIQQEIISDLNRIGINSSQDSEFPFFLSISSEMKSQILQSAWYQNGFLIFQDKASWIPVKLLDPHPGELIADLCAAPGMKSSGIALLTQSNVHLIASDYHPTRIKNMQKLLQKLQIKNIQLLNVDSIHYPLRDSLKFDKILLDAPCTGSGTFGLNPYLKWRQNESFLHQNTVLQEKLLKQALTLLNPGGILVYSTCSLYPEEGESQMVKISSLVNFLPLSSEFSPPYPIPSLNQVGMGRFFPSIHETQGFFFSKVEKKIE